jgi:hypothetical protein
VTLISGGNDGVEVETEDGNKRGPYGNVQVYVKHDGEDTTPQLTRYHPEIMEPADKLPSDLSCAELAQSGAPQLLFTNLAVASAICNAAWLLMCDALHYAELALDIGDGAMQPLPLPLGGKAAAGGPVPGIGLGGRTDWGS